MEQLVILGKFDRGIFRGKRLTGGKSPGDGGGGGVIQRSLSESQIKRSNYPGESFMGASCTEGNFPGVQLFRDNSLGQKPLGIIQRKMCLGQKSR